MNVAGGAVGVLVLCLGRPVRGWERLVELLFVAVAASMGRAG